MKKNYFRYLIYFLIAFSASLAIGNSFADPLQMSSALSIDTTQISRATFDSIAQTLQPIINIKTGNDVPGTPSEIVQYLLSFFGGLLTTIIMYFLHKWFPQVFPSKKYRDYIPPRNPNP